MSLYRTVIGILLLLPCYTVFAQEPVYMDAATHPGKGQLYLRSQLFYAENRSDSDVREGILGRLKLSYGIEGDFAALVDADYAHVRLIGGESASGLSKLTLRFKYRFFQQDMGPVDTWRASVLFGTDLPGLSDALSPKHLQPRLGIATTAILGRHGLNGALSWTGRPGSASDVFEINASHLYRIAPVRYSADTHGAWYTVLESLNSITDRGDSSSSLVVGLLYEARHWAAEVAVHCPIVQSGPYARRYELAFGFRYLF